MVIDLYKMIKEIKTQIKEISCLYLVDPSAFKVVETDTLEIGYESILKQVKINTEQIIQFISKHWNQTPQNHSSIKKKFQQTS